MSKARDIANEGHQLAAWVNFNGNFDGSGLDPANQFVLSDGIRGAYNVDYVVDGGTGDYKVHFENALPDANYCICLTAGSHSGSSPPAYFGPSVSSQQSQGYSYGSWETHDQIEIEDTHFRFQTAYPANTTIHNNQVICVSIFR